MMIQINQSLAFTNLGTTLKLWCEMVRTLFFAWERMVMIAKILRHQKLIRTDMQFSFFPYQIYQYKCVFCNRCPTLLPRYGPEASSVNLSNAWVAPKHGL